MSWLVLATTVLLASGQSQPPTAPGVHWVAYQPDFPPPEAVNQREAAPPAPLGVQPPRALDRVTPRIEPFEQERPPVVGPVEEEIEAEEAEEAEPGFSLNGILGLQEKGVSVLGTQLVDFSRVMGGGVNPGGGATSSYFDLALVIDSERFLSRRWTGGTFLFLFQDVPRSDASAEVGDAIVFDNIDLAESRTQLAEVFYEQRFFEEHLRVKLGKFDANSEFSFSNISGDFINSGFGPQPTTFDVMPTYPDPSTAIGVFLYPNDHLYLSFGMFDGRLVEGVPTGELSFYFGGPYWLVGEVGLDYTLPCRHNGRVAVGGWGHTFDAFERLDGTGTQNGQTGAYVYLDQTVWLERPWDEEDEQGIRAFLSYGVGDDNVNTFPQALTAGVTWTGMFRCRDDDVAGLGVAWGQFSGNDPTTDEDAEVAMELHYRLGLSPNFSVQPVVQYIANPGGDSTLDDAWVGTVRLIAEF